MPFVLDASATLAWLFEDELVDAPGYAPALRAFQAIEQDNATVPIVWALEVANGLWDGERRGRVTRAEASRFASRLDLLGITVDQLTPQYMRGPLLDVARTFNLTVYDATYLDLALRERLPLATLDRALERAARQAGVALFA